MALTLIVILRIRLVYWAFCVSESVWGPRGGAPWGHTNFVVLRTCDKADKSQSSRHIPCAVHLESLEILKSGRHDGACLLLLSVVSRA
jgi:hypothetical protein